jgi:hypothetical protein
MKIPYRTRILGVDASKQTAPGSGQPPFSIALPAGRRPVVADEMFLRMTKQEAADEEIPDAGTGAIVSQTSTVPSPPPSHTAVSPNILDLGPDRPWPWSSSRNMDVNRRRWCVVCVLG